MNDYTYIDNVRYEYDPVNRIIEVYREGETLGVIAAGENDWELILSGANPIEDGWEDGNGNTLSYDGWG